MAGCLLKVNLNANKIKFIHTRNPMLFNQLAWTVIEMEINDKQT